MPNSLRFPSPDRKQHVVLHYLGETGSGSGYYSLSIDKNPLIFPDRIFGKVCLWSPESRYISVQEWRETNEGIPTLSCLLLIIDPTARRECIIASVNTGKSEIRPQAFTQDSLMYTVIYEGQFGTTKNFESKFHQLDGWRAIK
jgi:hypothetical protein